MELSAGAALSAALIILLIGIVVVAWVADAVQKWREKKHPKPEKKPLKFNDYRKHFE